MNRYAVADLHGQLNLLLQIKEYINDDDILYVLGDSGDRGPHPWRTLKLCLDDPQIVYLMGNHDLMLINAIDQYLQSPDIELTKANYCYGKSPIALLDRNGGFETLKGWAAEPQRMDYYQKLRMLPLEVRLAALNGKHFIYLTHAGYILSRAVPSNITDFVWNRNHWYWRGEDLGGDVMVCGHTPVDALINDFEALDISYELKDGCLFHGGKINIDIGACRYNKTALLNIDTLEIETFTLTEDDVNDAQDK